MRQITAALLIAPGQPLRIVDDLTIDSPRRDEALIRVTHCGLCQSDLSIIDAKMPYPLPAVLGHEATGVIAELGSPSDAFAVGDRVVMSMRAPCDACHYCTNGQPVLCEHSAAPPGAGDARMWHDGTPVVRGFQLGAFAEYALVPLRALARVPDTLPPEQAAIAGCAVQTAYGSVVNVAGCTAQTSVCVIGLGGVGLATLMALRAIGATSVAAIEPSASRRAAARDLGAQAAWAPDPSDLLQQAQAMTGGRGFDVVLDNVASTDTSGLGLSLTRAGGQLVLIGVTGAPQAPGFSTMDLVMRQKTVSGAFLGNCHPHRDLPRILTMATDGTLPLAGLVTGTLPLRRINDGLDRLRRGDGIRTVICLSPDDPTHPEETSWVS